MATLNLRFTIDQDAFIEDYYEEDLITEHFPQDDGSNQIIVKDVDETLIESMSSGDLAEFFGIDREFVIACEVLEFA